MLCKDDKTSMVGSLKQSIKYPQNALMKSYSRLRWTSAFVSSSPKYTVHGEVWVVYNTSKSKDRNKGKASAKKQGERGGTLKKYTVGQEKK